MFVWFSGSSFACVLLPLLCRNRRILFLYFWQNIVTSHRIEFLHCITNMYHYTHHIVAKTYRCTPVTDPELTMILYNSCSYQKTWCLTMCSTILRLFSSLLQFVKVKVRQHLVTQTHRLPTLTPRSRDQPRSRVSLISWFTSAVMTSDLFALAQCHKQTGRLTSWFRLTCLQQVIIGDSDMMAHRVVIQDSWLRAHPYLRPLLWAVSQG